ncbi:MAG: sigma-70 family RNA polymerase sigma factor [Anaerolineales bacterium]
MRDDLILLQGIRNRDKRAIVEVFDKYATAIYRYAYRLCGNETEADDVVGDVFAQLLDHIKAGNGPRDNLRAYIYQMAYHRIVDKSRREKHLAELSDNIHSESTEWPHAKQEHNDLHAILIKTIQTHLTADQQHVILLRFFEGLSVHDTAEVLGKDHNNIKVIQSRGIAKLRQVLDIELLREIL